MDSFKGTLTSLKAGEIISDVFRAYGWKCKSIPIADGGEGTVEALSYATNAETIEVDSLNAFGEKIKSLIGIKGNSAFLEAANSIGITLVPGSKLHPLRASSSGLGKVVREAVNSGCDELYIGIGGTATNDLGIGMLGELGFTIIDNSGKSVVPVFNYGYSAADLGKVFDIKKTNEFDNIKIKILSDVKNPLTGIEGASHVYGPQKGADELMVTKLDEEFKRISKILRNKYSFDSDFPGAGAAGGLGYTLKKFFNSEITPGIEGVIELTKLQDIIQDFDFVIVGEGSMDSQSAYGKAPVGIAKLAKKFGKPVYAITGRATADSVEVFSKGIDSITATFKPDETPEFEELKNFAGKNLRDTAKLLVNNLISNIELQNKIIYLK